MVLSGLEFEVLRAQGEFSLLEDLVPETCVLLVCWGILARSLNVFTEQFGTCSVFCSEGLIAKCYRRPALFCVLQRG